MEATLLVSTDNCVLNALYASVISQIYRKYPREAKCFVVRIEVKQEFFYRR
jgi:hypothetical protein